MPTPPPSPLDKYADRDCFAQSEYEKECMEKLLHIKDTRQRQAAVAMQSGMMPQAGAMQNQAQSAFPQQMNRGIQPSPVSGQPQMAMGMNEPNQQMAMQQRQQQQSAMLQQQQRAQQRPANGVPLPDDLNTLSPQELEHVTRLANQMLSKTTPEDMEKIKMNLNNMNPEQRAYLARKNMDPMTYFFRSQALNQLRRHRRVRPDMNRGPNAGLDPNSAMMGDPMMNRQMFQNMMNLQRSGFPGNQGQNLDSNVFIGNVENIQGQQADGLRSQEAGQLVVPASSSQMSQQQFNNQQNMIAQGMGQNGQANMNGAGFNPQLFNQPMQGANPQQFQAQQSQVQAQAQARVQAAQKAQMAMSGHGNQTNPQAQAHLSQQSPVMPMLNQPMAPAQMSPAQNPAQPHPPSRPPNMGQLPAGVPQSTGMQAPQIPPGLPPQIQERLKLMKPEQVTAWLMNQRRAAMARASQQQDPLQQSASQPGQNQAMINGQMGNNRMRNSMSMPQGVNAGGQPGVQQLQGQQLTPQQRQQQQQNQQRQQDLYRMELMRIQSNVEMTPEQAKEMDRAPFPPSLINNNQSQVPPNIKTWGQLKQWATANPQSANGVDISKLMTLQRLHYNQIMTAQGKDPKAQAATHSFQGPQGQMGNAQQFQPGQPQPHMNMPQMRPITPQDIQMARQKLGPNSNNFSDDQIREILRNRQRQILMQAAQNRAQMSGNMPSAQNQSIQQPAVSAPQVMPQAKPQMPQQTQAASEAANAKTQTGPAGKGAKAPTAKQASKKRPSADDTANNQATATPQQAQTALPASTGPAKPGLPLTQDQMSPQQRLQVEAQMRRQQQTQLRGPTLSRAAAENAWNTNLPPKVMEVYNEIARNAPSSKPVPISPEQKAIMTQQLRDSLDVLGRLDVLVLHGFPKMQGQEKNIRNLLAMRIQLMRQFKDSPEWVVNDQFTITPDYLTGAILFIRKLFHVMMARMQQQRSSANQPSASGPQNQQAGTSALNANNLQQLQQQQEEALQRARRGSSQSAAVPPAPFGAPSPQGVPHAYGPGGLAPEKLKLPPPKKRKQSHAGASSSPIQASAAPLSAAKYKQDMAKSQAAVLTGAFKCSVVECQHHFQGFPTQAALDKHVEESHQPKEEEEVIEDPLQYYLDSVDIGLGLDAKTQQAKQAASTAAATTANKLSAASPAKQGMATPVTGSATPMARATSQLGTKTASPAVSAQQLTPQPAVNKGAKPAPGKDNKKAAGKEDEAKDPWADCPMSLEQIHDSFAPVFQECRRREHGYDPFEEFMNAEMFSGEQSDNTPDSHDVALATLTPDDNKDESKAIHWQDWVPWDAEAIGNTANWMEIPPELALHDDASDGIDGVQVDFTGLEHQQKEMNLDDTGLSIPAI